ncbi:prolyl oligopeptidase family serine peptidase [Actinomadura miaoliensis]|uniref:Peptidase S9 prolyl oligopeptidase catalytic domain-containing protein n=1 Tax=Actinomadura miaoliensis TaxID=430685 RepID=A0ABP7UV89_9ACTN
MKLSRALCGVAVGLQAVPLPPGVHQGRRADGTTVVVSESLHSDLPRVSVYRHGQPIANIASHAEPPVLTPRVELLHAGKRELRTAVLLPTWHEPGMCQLPVLMDPYGGPGKQRVLAARGRYLVSQRFADQGFAVVVADGRGTPGRGPAWERTIYGDKGHLPLEDQISALYEAKEHHPDLDLGRVKALETYERLRRERVERIAAWPVLESATKRAASRCACQVERLQPATAGSPYLPCPLADADGAARTEIRARERPRSA